MPHQVAVIKQSVDRLTEQTLFFRSLDNEEARRDEIVIG